MTDQKTFVNNTLEAAIRIGVVILLAVWCFDIARPFVIPIIWGVIILDHKRFRVWQYQASQV